MPRIPQPGEFFVVGGPVQPDRPCYVPRDADEELDRCIAEQRFCYVLAPRATGKSSLMARAIRKLRSEGQLAAVVDLSQLGVRRDGADAGRWYYNVAYRILRELRLKVDLQSWWQEKSALMSEQRLAEFFWEVVLANTTVPVTVFFDGIERALGLPFAQELYSAIRACYTRRATEPDYARLNFVVLGSAAHAQLCPDMSVSPFPDGHAIELADFTLEQSCQLAAGLGTDRERARRALAEIHDWTGGQPYLTQKVARGVARKGGDVDDVERVIREQLMAPGVTREEPLLGHIRQLLTGNAPPARQALILLDKIGRGVEVYDEPGAPAHEWLRMSGIVSVGPGGRLHYRNRLYRMLFSSRWTSAALPFNWRAAAGVAAAITALVLVPLWYTYYLPRPYVRTLSVVTQDVAVAEEAYQKLRRLPGFARTADDLLAEAMTRRARQADSHAEVSAAARVLRGLPQRDRLADELMSEFWLLRAREEAHRERRDAALLYALQALPGRQREASGVLAELIGQDYRHLERSYRLPAAPAQWEVDWERGALTLVDRSHRAERLWLPDHGEERRGASAGRLTALQHVPLRRELSVEQRGSAGRFELLLSVRHPSAGDLTLTLEAPGGAQATVTLPRHEDVLIDHTVRAAGNSPLAALAGEERQGVWRLTIVDAKAGAIGTLLGWGLRFGGDLAAWDEPEQGIAIPDPVRTDQVDVALGVGGATAAAQPVRPGTVGAVALWNLVDGELTGELPMHGAATRLAFTADGRRLVSMAGDSVTLWDVRAAAPVARLTAETRFVLPPAIGVDGEHVALAERNADGGVLKIRLLQAENGELVASSEGWGGTTAWALGSQARYLALLGPSRVLRIVDPRRGVTVREHRHERDVVRLVPLAGEDRLLTVDGAGEIHLWPTESTEDPRPGDRSAGRRLGTTADPASLSVSADGSTLAFEAPHGYVVALRVDGHGEPQRLRIERSGAPVRTRLSPDGRRLLTGSGALLRLWSIEDYESRTVAFPDLTALALDAQGRTAALGFQGGHVRVRSATELHGLGQTEDVVDYIGHRGAVTALALDGEQGLIASGGADGAVRVWDLASVAPRPHFMRHPEGPIRAVAVSGEGQRVASAAEYSARLWNVRDGELAGEIAINGTALAVAFSPDAELVAVGDSAGNVFLAPAADPALAFAARAQGAVRALAFAPRGGLLATGDDAGHVHLWDSGALEPAGEPHVFPHPVRWLRFSDDGESLVVQTEHWLHRLAVDGGRMRVLDSRLPTFGPQDGAAFADAGGERLRLVGGLAAGRPYLNEIELGAAAVNDLPPQSPLLARDWPRVLGLRIGATGNVASIYR